MHGIRTGPATTRREPEDVLHLEIDARPKNVQAAQNEVSRAKENLQARLASKVVGAESHRLLEEARKQQKAAQIETKVSCGMPLKSPSLRIIRDQPVIKRLMVISLLVR